MRLDLVWPGICDALMRTKNNMTCRYAHRRVLTLFTVVQQATPAARVIDWPKHSPSDKRLRHASTTDKSQPEATYEDK